MNTYGRNLTRLGRTIALSLSASLIFSGVLYAADDDAQKLKALAICAKEPSALERLDCYDGLLRPASPMAGTVDESAVQRSNEWTLAHQQEKQRQENDTAFITNDTGGDNPTVLLTTPALGRQPPRPILTFSCIDNITRMQIMLPMPMRSTDGNVTLITDKDEIKTRWFIRDNGYVFEASRGLPGITEIQRLIHAQRLTVKSSDPALNGLTFNISTLPQAIVPLRAACHW